MPFKTNAGVGILRVRKANIQIQELQIFVSYSSANCTSSSHKTIEVRDKVSVRKIGFYMHGREGERGGAWWSEGNRHQQSVISQL